MIFSDIDIRASIFIRISKYLSLEQICYNSKERTRRWTKDTKGYVYGNGEFIQILKLLSKNHISQVSTRLKFIFNLV